MLWNDYLDGPRAVPGEYKATLTVDENDYAVDLRVLPDPRSSTTPEGLQRQFDFVWGVNRKLTDTHQAITRLREVREQVAAVGERVGDAPEFNELATQSEALVERLDAIEQALYQVELEAPQDPLNFPIRLNDKLAGVMLAAAIGDHPPTASAVAVRDELFAAIDAQLAALDEALGEELDAFNALAAELALPAVAGD